MGEQLYVGAHLSISSGFSAATEAAVSLGANTFQFFTRNPRGAKSKAVDEADAHKAAELAAAKGFGPLVAHSPYIVNLASAEEKIWELAVHVLQEDLGKIARYGCPYLVAHPGSHTGWGVDYGLGRVAEAINAVLPAAAEGMILLETMAGMGTEVGATFEQLAAIIGEVDRPERVGVCLDTCHVYAAGYDVKERFGAVLDEFDRVIGLGRLKAMHINDSRYPLGSKKDRHADLGEGQIGEEGLRRILGDARIHGLPLILETPGGVEDYARQIALLRSLT